METYWERLTERVSLLTPFLIEPTREHEKKRKKRRQKSKLPMGDRHERRYKIIR